MKAGLLINSIFLLLIIFCTFVSSNLKAMNNTTEYYESLLNAQAPDKHSTPVLNGLPISGVNVASSGDCWNLVYKAEKGNIFILNYWVEKHTNLDFINRLKSRADEIDGVVYTNKVFTFNEPMCGIAFIGPKNFNKEGLTELQIQNEIKELEAKTFNRPNSYKRAQDRIRLLKSYL